MKMVNSDWKVKMKVLARWFPALLSCCMAYFFVSIKAGVILSIFEILLFATHIKFFEKKLSLPPFVSFLLNIVIGGFAFELFRLASETTLDAVFGKTTDHYQFTIVQAVIFMVCVIFVLIPILLMWFELYQNQKKKTQNVTYQIHCCCKRCRRCIYRCKKGSPDTRGKS